MAGKFGLTEAARTPTSTHLLHRIVSERCDRGFLLFKFTAALENIECGSWNYAIFEASLFANHLMEAIDQFQFGGKSLPNSYKEARIDRNADFIDGFKENFSEDMHFIRQSEALIKRGMQAYKERAVVCVRVLQEICAALGIELRDV